MRPIYVVIKTYNRPKPALRLLRDLRRELPKDHPCRVYVFDDGSSHDYSEVESFAMKETVGPSKTHWTYHRFKTNHGKIFAWQMVTSIFQILKGDGVLGALTFFLDDDMRLCRSFFRRAIETWGKIQQPKKATLHLMIDSSRQGQPCWTAYPPVRIDEHVTRTQWVDGAFMCDREFFGAINFRIDPIPRSRWGPGSTASTGVGSQLSKRLHNGGFGMYQVNRSLVVHTQVPSEYNPEDRQAHPLDTVDFVDEDIEAKLLSEGPMDAVQASLASVPERDESLARVVEALLPQVDLLRVYLNGYESVPGFLRTPEVVVARSQDHGDLGDAGKFFWCEENEGYQLVCDDDLAYPADYAMRMVGAIERHDREAVVGLHGVLLREPMLSYYADRHAQHFSSRVDKASAVHVLGTGCMAYHAHTLVVRRRDFELPNMADVWMGLVCQRQRTPMMMVSREEGWLTALPTKGSTIYDTHRNSDGPQTEAVRRVWPWRIYQPSKS